MNRSAPPLIGVASALAVLLAASALWFIPQADIHRADQLRADQQRGGCVQYNAQQQVVIAGDKAEIRILIEGLAPHPTAVTEARIRAFLPIYDKVVDETHPFRDCTPAGIARYLRKKAR